MQQGINQVPSNLQPQICATKGSLASDRRCKRSYETKGVNQYLQPQIYAVK